MRSNARRFVTMYVILLRVYRNVGGFTVCLRRFAGCALRVSLRGERGRGPKGIDLELGDQDTHPSTVQRTLREKVAGPEHKGESVRRAC